MRRAGGQKADVRIPIVSSPLFLVSEESNIDKKVCGGILGVQVPLVTKLECQSHI